MPTRTAAEIHELLRTYEHRPDACPDLVVVLGHVRRDLIADAAGSDEGPSEERDRDVRLRARNRAQDLRDATFHLLRWLDGQDTAAFLPAVLG